MQKFLPGAEKGWWNMFSPDLGSSGWAAQAGPERSKKDRLAKLPLSCLHDPFALGALERHRPGIEGRREEREREGRLGEGKRRGGWCHLIPSTFK